MDWTGRSAKSCESIESKLIEFLDGRARPAERRAVETHLAGCAACRARAEEFGALWSALDDLPEVSPSPAFDASLRARIAAEPVRLRFWHWIPSPRLAFAVTSLIAMSVWLSSMPGAPVNPSAAQETIQGIQIAAESEFGMIRDLPVLENYDVVSKFDALSELPEQPPPGMAEEGATETR